MPVQHHLLSVPSPAAEEAAPVIQVRNLSFTYPDGWQALQAVSFTLHQGEKAALVGANGAGKSTLMLHLNGILGDVQAANPPIQIAGRPLTRTHLPQIRAQVGLVFQNPDDQLFSPTVFEDVAFGPLHMGLPEAEVRRRVAEALAQVGMADFADRLSHHLSMGQKKRVAMATVLAMRPAILVLDEPSAGLDPRGRRALIELLRTLPITMLVSTHDLRLVQELFPRLIIMDAGRIVADGPTAALLPDAALLQQYGLQE